MDICTYMYMHERDIQWTSITDSTMDEVHVHVHVWPGGAVIY